jgi:ABC-2 type transport system ATP-binding protein
VSFAIEEGTLFALLGPNGAGKTTTISILTTTLSATSGSVRIAGHDLATQENAVRQSVGIIFQAPSLDMNLSGEENVRFHAALYGLYPFRPAFRMMPAAYRSAVVELAGVVGIGDDLSKPVKTYSGGMRRKLEIVRSLIHKPRVLFLDEPTVGLDPLSRRNLHEYLRHVRQDDGTTILLTTHYLDEAEDSDDVRVINKGRIVAGGTPDALKNQYTGHYLLLDAADRGALAEELRRLETPFEDTGAALRIACSDHHAQLLLRRIETPLTVLRTQTPTLEDAYLAIVGRDEEEEGATP